MTLPSEYSARFREYATAIDKAVAYFIMKKDGGARVRPSIKKRRIKMKKKIPYGFFAGLSGILAFYLTAAIIVVFVILNRIEAETNGSANLFGTWYQILLFVLDLIFVASAVFFIIKAVIGKKKKDRETHDKEVAR